MEMITQQDGTYVCQCIGDVCLRIVSFWEAWALPSLVLKPQSTGPGRTQELSGFGLLLQAMKKKITNLRQHEEFRALQCQFCNHCGTGRGRRRTRSTSF